MEHRCVKFTTRNIEILFNDLWKEWECITPCVRFQINACPFCELHLEIEPSKDWIKKNCWIEEEVKITNGQNRKIIDFN